MGLWLIIIAGFVAYVAADAAWDISKKISAFVRLRALPFLGRVWGAVVGERKPGKARSVSPAAVTDIPPKAPPVTVSATGETDIGQDRPVVTISGIFGFPRKYGALILIVGVFIVGASIIDGFGFGASKDRLRLEREIAEANTRIAEHEAALGALSGRLAENAARDSARRRAVITQAEQELTDAAAEADLDALHPLYTRLYQCVLDERACEGVSDPAAPSAPGVRGPSPRVGGRTAASL